jgi:hypothetical protein
MTVIELDDDSITYKKNTNSYNQTNVFYIILILFIIFLLSVCYSLLLYFEWNPLLVLQKFKRIKKNMTSWDTITKNKNAIESEKGKLLYLSNKNVAKLQCLDFDNYYVVGRISSENYLPEFIKRGDSGPWMIKKLNKKDVAAQQFCLYILTKYANNTITCGLKMYEKLGYSGYFYNNSPCEKAISVFSSLNNN